MHLQQTTLSIITCDVFINLVLQFSDLVDAIASANDDIAVGACYADSGADLIQMHDLQIRFDSANHGDSTLPICTDITIEGSIISGAGAAQL